MEQLTHPQRYSRPKSNRDDDDQYDMGTLSFAHDYSSGTYDFSAKETFSSVTRKYTELTDYGIEVEGRGQDSIPNIAKSTKVDQTRRIKHVYNHLNAGRIVQILEWFRLVVRVLSCLASAYIISINAEVLDNYSRSRYLEHSSYTDISHVVKIVLRAWPYHANIWAPYVIIGVSGISVLVSVVSIARRTWMWWKRRSRKATDTSVGTHPEMWSIMASAVLTLGWIAILAIMKSQSKHAPLAGIRAPTGSDFWTWTCDAVDTRIDSYFGAVARYRTNCKLLTSTFYLVIPLLVAELANILSVPWTRRLARRVQGYAHV